MGGHGAIVGRGGRERHRVKPLIHGRDPPHGYLTRSCRSPAVGRSPRTGVGEDRTSIRPPSGSCSRPCAEWWARPSSSRRTGIVRPPNICCGAASRGRSARAAARVRSRRSRSPAGRGTTARGVRSVAAERAAGRAAAAVRAVADWFRWRPSSSMRWSRRCGARSSGSAESGASAFAAGLAGQRHRQVSTRSRPEASRGGNRVQAAAPGRHHGCGRRGHGCAPPVRWAVCRHGGREWRYRCSCRSGTSSPTGGSRRHLLPPRLGRYDRLEIGTRVRFEETMGRDGPQATIVQILGKPGATPAGDDEPPERAEPPRDWQA